jgi:hypothetical protein
MIMSLRAITSIMVARTSSLSMKSSAMNYFSQFGAITYKANVFIELLQKSSKLVRTILNCTLPVYVK